MEFLATMVYGNTENCSLRNQLIKQFIELVFIILNILCYNSILTKIFPRLIKQYILGGEFIKLSIKDIAGISW